MYFYLTGALNDLLVERIREFWTYHPRFQDLAHNTQGKYSYEERPQRGIVVKTTGGSQDRLTWDNYMGVQEEYAYQVQVGNYPGVSIEFIREDKNAVQNNGGVFPSPPGSYLVSIVESKLDPMGTPTGRHKFIVDPMLDIRDEGVDMLPDRITGLLRNIPIEGSLRLYEIPSNVELLEGVNYTVDYESGEITLERALPLGLYLSADYRYTGVRGGPFDIEMDRANFTAIPGVILGFGRRITPGDKMFVLVVEQRETVALVYGGKWNLSVELDLWARDVDDQREMADLLLEWLPSVFRDNLAGPGVWIESVSFGGETEEPYDETGDLYFYGASISMEVKTDWMLFKPLPVKLTRVLPLRADQLSELAGLTDIEVAQQQSNLELVQNLRLRSFRDPFFLSLNRRFEMIR